MTKRETIIGLGGATFTLGGGVAMAFGPSAYPDLATQFFWFGIVIMVLGLCAIAFAWTRPDSNQPAGNPRMPNDIYNNTGVNFGHMGPINYSNQKLIFTADLGAQLIERMAETKPIELRTIGSVVDQGVGSEIQEFLSGKGYSIRRTQIGMMVPPPDQKITIYDDGQQYIITVAPSA